MTTLVAIGEGGRTEEIVLDINDAASPSIAMCRTDGRRSIHAAVDLFECLTEVRLDLEREGLLLCCQGARRTVFPSGLSRQMSNGRLAYPLRRDPPLSDDDLLDVFAPAAASEVATVEEQRRIVRQFFGF